MRCWVSRARTLGQLACSPVQQAPCLSTAVPSGRSTQVLMVDPHLSGAYFHPQHKGHTPFCLHNPLLPGLISISNHRAGNQCFCHHLLLSTSHSHHSDCPRVRVSLQKPAALWEAAGGRQSRSPRAQRREGGHTRTHTHTGARASRKRHCLLAACQDAATFLHSTPAASASSPLPHTPDA